MKRTDWNFLLSYIAINAIIVLTYHFNLFNREFIAEYYFLIPFIFAFLIFDIFHKQFWNQKVLLIWVVIALIQLAVYFSMKDIPEFQTVRGNKLEWLKAIPIVLLTSFILNKINRKIYGDNFIITMLRLNPNRIDPRDGRKLRNADYAFSLIGFFIMIFGTVLTP